jgi:hypothetical protein
VSLEEDLPNEMIYRKFAEWTLSVATMADPNTKNPSRSIRIPGAFREPGKRQKMIEFKGPVSILEFAAWLNNHPGCKPKEHEKRIRSDKPDVTRVSPWVANLLVNGLDPTKGRNKQWFSISCEFACAGYSEDDTLEVLSDYFVPDRDFTEREWKTTIESAFSYIYERKQ